MTGSRFGNGHSIRTVVAVGAIVAGLAFTGASCSASQQPAAMGVGGVSAQRLTGQGIFLGPPGRLPAGTPRCGALPAVATTSIEGAASAATTPVSATTEENPAEAAVRGDPANGRAKVSSSFAATFANAHRPPFTGTVDVGPAVLLQFKDVNGTCVVATVWAVPLTGLEQLSCGPAVTAGTTPRMSASCASPSTLIFFIDAVTGRLIDAPGFDQD
jgi:hypothetical protein